jgi:DNA-binding LacI/PurR family transcriptional regulator
MEDSFKPFLFCRTSLIEQTTQAIRMALQTGALPDPLPGEHQLASRLGVSRPTLRAALAKLAREGLLRVAKGRRTRLAVRRKPRAKSTPPSVCIICPLSREVIFPDEHPVLLPMHTRFAAEGIAWEEIFDAKVAGPHPEVHLQQLVAQRRNTCWILLASTARIQSWFVQSGAPTLVLGSCHPGVKLPSIDIDYRAVGWHAAGVMLQHGHRQLVLLLPSQPLAGDIACREGFLAYVARASCQTSLLEINAGESPQELRPKLNRVLNSPSRPTVIFSVKQHHALTTLLYLLERGYRVPQQVSLVMRDLHPLLGTALPGLTHYSRPTGQLVNRALRLAQALLSGRSVPARPNLVTPVFVPGQTLAQLP